MTSGYQQHQQEIHESLNHLSNPMQSISYKYTLHLHHITNFGLGLYSADDARAKLCTTVNGKLNAARERQTKSPTSTTGTGTTSRSIQKLHQSTQRVKIKKQARENQLEEAPEKLCLHHGKIREDL